MGEQLDVGDVLEDKVELVRRIGEGGMGTVFEGRHRRTGRSVAVKVLRPALASSAEAAQRFLQEARACGRIRHPNVVDILDASIAGAMPYIVMELLEGESLGERIEREGPLPTSEAVDMLVQALDGVAAAHGQGVIHRDLKPDNLFLAKATSGATVVKVVDFGISKIASAEPLGDTALALTGHGGVVGTPLFMSPEQARGHSDIDARTDVYAAGAVLYTLLAGRPPFVAPNYNALLAQILMDEPPSLNELREELPVSLVRIVERAMAKDRSERFQSAFELAERLRRQTRLIEGVTILMTDLVGFNNVARTAPLDTVERVLEHWERLHIEVATRHGGALRAIVADEMLCSFPSPKAAVRAWLELSDEGSHPEDLRAGIRFRAGISIGDIRIVRSAMYGDALTLCAYITRTGAPGALSMLPEVRQELGNQLSSWEVATRPAPTPGGSEPGSEFQKRASKAVTIRPGT